METQAPEATWIKKLLIGEEVETDTSIRKDPRSADDGDADFLALLREIEKKQERLSETEECAAHAISDLLGSST